MRLTLASLCSLFISTSMAAPINNNAVITDLSTSTGNTLDYELSVPAGSSNLTIAITSGSGDADLYVRAGSQPTTSTYDCRPYLIGNNESCSFASPATTTYYIGVRAYSTFSGVTLSANYDNNNGGSNTSVTTLSNGQTLSALQGSQGTERDFIIEVPANAQNLNVSTSGGSGDVDLYVKYGSQASTSHYDCRPYRSGNNESCSFATPSAGTYHIMLRAYSSYSNASLTASFQRAGGSGGNTGSTWDGFENYYANAIGKSGMALVNALHEAAARNHNRMSYSQVWDALRYTDEDPNNTNNVILIYTGRSQSKNFTSSGNNDPDAWNREHSWPKSHGFPSSGDWAYTDIHHLRPSDASVNSSRGNKDYDNGGSSISEAPGNFTDSNSFEPRDEVKGDVARMMFYMDTRYNGGDNTGTEDLVLVDYSGTNGSELGDLCTLLNWHNQDPVSQREIDRHARIVERQGNRNPFVDYPAWANEIWDSACN